MIKILFVCYGMVLTLLEKHYNIRTFSIPTRNLRHFYDIRAKL